MEQGLGFTDTHPHLQATVHLPCQLHSLDFFYFDAFEDFFELPIVDVPLAPLLLVRGGACDGCMSVAGAAFWAKGAAE